MLGLLDIRRRLSQLSTDLYVAWLAFRDPRTPWPARLATILFALYVINPLDVFPDMLPLLGIVDDATAIVLSIGVLSFLAPKPVIEAAYRRAEESGAPDRILKIIFAVLAFLVIVWIAFVGLLIYAIYRALT